MQAITQSLSQGLGTFFSYLPLIVGAIVILVIGFIIAKILQSVTTKVLQSMGFENWMEQGGVKQFFERSQTQQTPLSILGKLVFWLVFFIAIVMAVDTLGISAISQVFSQFIAYIPQIIAAVLILILAALLANFVAGVVRGATGMNVLGTAAQAAIIVFAGFAALTQLGIAPELIAPTFLILLGSVALAAAIAFGWGARNVAQDIVEKGYNRSDEARRKIQQERQRQGGSEGGSQGGSRSGSGDRLGRERGGDSGGGNGDGHSLVKLSASDFVLDDRAEDVRGRKVYDRDDNEIGKVEDLYVDENEQVARFLDVSAGGTLGMGKKHFLVPFDAVTGVSSDRLTLDKDRDTVTNAPDFEEEEHPDRRYQQSVYRHYGMA
ncbi:MAG: PRC-barrel domain-containing protein [Rubrobacter sp.]|jgi:sporulation protein YlmC with PRC-barrel domain/uncharacterized membrane protein YgcG|nr:PRC-barrel domain-containing protein [Rubrobacter sp.]